MKVYVVQDNDRDCPWVEGVFSTKEKAEKSVGKYLNQYNIQEYVIDCICEEMCDCQ